MELQMKAAVRGRDLRGVDFSYSTIPGIDFSGSSLRVLRHADLTDVNLTRADLTRADLTRADLAGVILAFAKLSNANLRGVCNLTQAQLDSALYEKGRPPKNLPEGLSLREGERHEEEEDGHIYMVLSAQEAH